MTTYDTTALATAIIGEDAVTTNRKATTRTLRKFLRTDFVAREVPTPGKGGRYAIDLNKRDLAAMTKRFNAWKAAEDEANEARKVLKASTAAAVTAPIEDAPIEDAGDDADAPAGAEGPSDEEIAALLAEDDEELDEV